MEKTKYLAIALVVMVIINLVLIVVYVSPGGNESKQKGRRGGLNKLVVEVLQLDEEQEQQYINLRRMHKEEVGNIMEIRNELKNQLINTKDDSTASVLIGEIAALQAKLEWESRDHFLKVKALCTREQLPYYDTLTQRMGRWMTRNQRKN